MNTLHLLVTIPGAVMLLSGLPCRGDSTAPGRWTQERANGWYATQPWLVGCNFIPSTACNQLEMWQAATFDAATIDRELGYAERLGFTSVRVFLHDLLWLHDQQGLMRRVDQFLGLAQKHRMGVMLVLLDSCWNPLPKAGSQPEPRPRTHNAGWAQSPRIEALKNPASCPHLKEYVIGIIKRFKDDRRIQVWDVWNEPGNFDGGSAQRPGLEPKNKPELVRPLLKQVFAWAREANPSQPLTSAPWAGPNDDAPPNPIEAIQLSHSDVISFHFYGHVPGMEQRLKPLRKLGRPILCTECVGRIGGGQFDPIYGFLKQQRVGAYCWGLVAGRTQTIYPGDSWVKPYIAEPPVWCCDLLRPDGTAYKQEEVDYIRRVTGRESAFMKELKLLVFDVFGTTVDWRGSVIAECEQFGRAKGLRVDWAAFTDAWRAACGPSMNKVRRGELPWTNLDDLHRLSLEELLRRFKIEGLTEKEKDHLNRVWHRLKPWPDSVEGLRRLKKRYRVAPLSNGNVALLSDMAKHAGLLWDRILSAELVRRYKPDPEVYRCAFESFGLKPGEVMMVAAHPGDLTVPKSLGMKTAYVHRPKEHGGKAPKLPPPDAFDFVVNDFLELASQLGL